MTAVRMETQKLTFEEALGRLQDTVKRLESGELSLEQSLQSFEEGVKLARFCQEHLGAAERRIEVLTRAGTDSGAELAPFAPKES